MYVIFLKAENKNHIDTALKSTAQKLQLKNLFRFIL